MRHLQQWDHVARVLYTVEFWLIVCWDTHMLHMATKWATSKVLAVHIHYPLYFIFIEFCCVGINSVWEISCDIWMVKSQNGLAILYEKCGCSNYSMTAVLKKLELRSYNLQYPSSQVSYLDTCNRTCTHNKLPNKIFNCSEVPLAVCWLLLVQAYVVYFKLVTNPQ